MVGARLSSHHEKSTRPLHSRLFIAIRAPASLVSKLELFRMAHASEIVGRWVPPERFHLTLRFVGEAPSRLVVDLARLVGPVCAHHARFDVEWIRLGAFPNTRNARGLWIGPARAHARLQALRQGVERAVQAVPVACELRPFRAHLTLVRFKKSSPSLRALIRRENGQLALKAWSLPVRFVSLLSSVSSLHGLRYEELERWPLERATQRSPPGASASFIPSKS